MTETHWQRGEINDERHKLIFQSLKETVEELARRCEIHIKEAKESEGDQRFSVATNVSRLCILCLPVRDEADEIAGTMLSQLSAMKGCVVEAVSVTSLASEMVELVEEAKPMWFVYLPCPQQRRRMRVTSANVFRAGFPTHT